MGKILEPLMVQSIHFVAGLIDAHINGDVCYAITAEAIMIARSEHPRPHCHAHKQASTQVVGQRL